MSRPLVRAIALALCALAVGGCASARVGTEATREGDEIVVCGRRFHTGAPVVLWSDPGGYDAYRANCHFNPTATRPSQPASSETTGARYGARPLTLLDATSAAAVSHRGWDVPELAQAVQQFVVHYDVCGTSRECFRILHDVRGLSVHFMLDLDGTIYQTLDVKERAWHASVANDRSIGVEIANIGAYPDQAVISKWYRRDADGRTRMVMVLPNGMSELRTPGFVPRPARNDAVRGPVQGRDLWQHDFTDAQYDSLIRLIATLRAVLPGIAAVAPTEPDGTVTTHMLTAAERQAFAGVLGHFHVDAGKTDPGPAFDWARVLGGVRALAITP